MARIEAAYADGASAVYDDESRPLVTGDAALLGELDAQRGVGTPVKGAVPLALAAYDASPDHFIAATVALRAPETPTLRTRGVEVQAEPPVEAPDASELA